MYRVRKTEDGVDTTKFEAASPRKRHRSERGEEHLMRDGICLSLEDTVRAVDIGETGLLTKNRYT